MSGSVIRVDFSRPLSRKEAAAFQARESRLAGAFGESAAKATSAFTSRTGAPGRLAEGLRIRTGFSCLQAPITEDTVSDRSAPPLDVRPPATRILTAQGAALRLYLTAIAFAQVNVKPSAKFTNELPLIGDSQSLGWDDLIATGAVPSGTGRNTSMTRDKKGRSLRTALNNLDRSGLVQLLGLPQRRGRHEGFVLLNDIGHQNPGEPLQYTVPANREDYFVLPTGFITNGWINVLEDSEIAVLLMIACGRYSMTRLRPDFDLLDGEVAISGDDRLRHYGIHRDRFSYARKTLEWFGLLDVREIDRHWGDGRSEDGNTQLHRLRLVPEGLQEEALPVVRKALAAQLSRRSDN